MAVKAGTDKLPGCLGVKRRSWERRDSEASCAALYFMSWFERKLQVGPHPSKGRRWVCLWLGSATPGCIWEGNPVSPLGTTAPSQLLVIRQRHSKHTSQISLREHGADVALGAQVAGESESPERAAAVWWLQRPSSLLLLSFAVNHCQQLPKNGGLREKGEFLCMSELPFMPPATLFITRWV